MYGSVQMELVKLSLNVEIWAVIEQAISSARISEVTMLQPKQK